MTEDTNKKSSIAETEEKTLKFWQEKRIFKKSLEKPSPKGEFIFYEGPPTANGKPGIHHLEARAFKDAIPRYKTMQGFHVRRKGGWDTHGLPVEIQVEKELGLKSKKEIEEYGIAAFNQKCRESVWTYVDLWRKFTDRIGYWVDLDNPYVTYSADYVESLWAIMKKVHERGLLYKDYKVVPWCPRCGTGLSSHELAQGYEDVKDLAVTVKFKVKSKKEKEEDLDTYILAWTTTPWTLPGNVGLAINQKIVYCKVKSLKSKVKSEEEIVGNYIIAKARLGSVLKDYDYEIAEELKGEELVGLSYEPLYPFLSDNLPASERDKLKNAFKVYPADFVTTEDGTGVVHTAVMYGEDDFELGTKVGLPKFHLVNEDGTFKKETGFLSGKFVKDEAVAVEIIKDLAHRGLLFAKEKYEHSYPFCWRCHTALIYFARDSWYIKMSALRDDLVKENEKINWEPNYFKEGRFGDWLREIKDWAISRERYWGTPLPVWQCDKCQKTEVVGSFDEVRLRTSGSLTKIILVRHGESEKNTKNIFSSAYDVHPLTKTGEAVAEESAKLLSGEQIDAVYVSPVLRTKQTADIIAKKHKAKIAVDERLREVNGGLWDEKSMDDPKLSAEQGAYWALPSEEFFKAKQGGIGESWQEVEERMMEFLKDIISRHKGETILVVSHEGPLVFLMRYLRNLPIEGANTIFKQGLVGGFAVPKSVFVDNKTGKEFNPHRPRIDEAIFDCACGGKMKRVKEVMDVWFDSGAMPFAQDHYPFENSKRFEKGGFPADFISEAIDQTRGWFYTLHAVGILLKRGRAYKNVICLGHILDAKGKKMSKSIGNVVDPWEMMARYGVDALRLFMYSVNQPGESKNFDEKTVDEIVRKFFNLTSNVLAFYQLYASSPQAPSSKLKASHVLDRWIVARLNQLTAEVTENLDNYRLFEPVRAIRDFIADLSQWYLRRSRERIKAGGVDGEEALQTLRYVLLELAKLMAPFAPFFAEHLYQSVGGEKESVHLENWPKGGAVDEEILAGMNFVRSFTSMALMQRAENNIKTRQPLQRLSIKHTLGKDPTKHWKELVEILKDEINVKEVVLDTEMGQDDPPVKLDIAITPELQEEGDVRELVRAFQDLRKEMKLSPSDKVSISVETEEKGKAFLQKHQTALSKSAMIADFIFGNVSEGVPIKSGGFSFKIKFASLQ